MATGKMVNGVREARAGLGWSQEALAKRAGLSRAEVSAIETGRVVPSTLAALALGRVLGRSVEALFREGSEWGEAAWAWARGQERRYWVAEMDGRLLRYPVEATLAGVMAHDGVEGSASGVPDVAEATRTLVVAGCDPAMGLLVHVLARRGVRVLALVRSSARALELLAKGLVHVAGVHLGEGTAGNIAVARRALGGRPRVVHVARWTEGLVLARGLGHRTVSAALRARLRWVGREEGSGARRCMDQLLAGRRMLPEGWSHTATDHRGVVETIRTGWAQAGVCVQLAAAEGGLDFMPLREEDYDLCHAAGLEADARMAALLDALRSQSYARLLADLPGYDVRRTGELA